MDARVGYEVIFDDHNGTAEMIIDVQQIGVYRYETPMMDEEVTI
jgi:hypothetical protein